MVLRNNQQLTPEVRSLIIKDSATRVAFQGLAETVGVIERNLQSLLVTRSNTPAAPVANLLWNGEIGHSVNTWHDTSTVTTDKSKEAAWWFSHNKPAASQTFTTISVANQIPLTAHQFSTGQLVSFTTTGTLPTGLSTIGFVYVIKIDANTISVASSLANAFAGTASAITAGTGSGTHTIAEYLYSVDARSSSTNNTLKRYTHSTYSARYSRWDATNGLAELTGTMSVDQILPANFVDATTSLARVSLIAAKKNSFIEIPDDCLMGAGIYDNTSGQRKFLEGSIALSASVVGTPAVGVERRYKVLITSDQGYQLLSSEVTIATAPKDSEFSSTCYVALSWQQQAGQLQAEIYEYLPTGGNGGGAAEYRLITQISSLNSYIHLGSYLSTESGYPTATGTARSATYYTETGTLSDLATNGVSSSWDTINFPCGVPNNYNKGNTTDRQWIRIWLTVAANLYVTGCTTDGSTTITIPSGAVDSSAVASGGYGTGGTSIYAGLTIEVYDSNDSLITTTTISSVTSDTSLVLGTTVATGSDRKIRIVGGGFHGVYIDKIHLGFQNNTSYAPNAIDVRTLQPVAAPSSSSQGGVGAGGTGGGVPPYCIAGESPVKLQNGERVPIELCLAGEHWDSAGLHPNPVLKIKPGYDFVRTVISANGIKIRCTDTERFVVSPTDFNGKPLSTIRVGDPVMTEIDGRIEASTMAYIGPLETSMTWVYTPSLANSHLFIAGAYENPRSYWTRLWHSWRERLFGIPQPQSSGGFILHNRKYDEP